MPIPSFVLSWIPMILTWVSSTVDHEALMKALVLGEVQEPGFIGPLKQVVAQADVIIKNDTIRPYFVDGLNWLIGRYSTAKLAHFALAQGITVDGAHASTDDNDNAPVA